MPVHGLGALIQSNKFKVMKNTILFSKLNPHKDKRIWLITSLISENSVCSTEFQVMKPKNEKYLFFLYGFIRHPENYNEIAAGVGGTSGSHQRLDPDVIFKFTCFLQDNSTLTKYNEIVEPIFGNMNHNRKSIQNLIHQRDLLLPKLMSGEVRVKL
jgi:type I restriction enzyme S subunit